MSNIDVNDNFLSFLTTVPVGSYKCAKWYEFWKKDGWISVNREDGITSVMWSSDKDSHNLLDGPSIIIDINSYGQMVTYFKSAITMWIKWMKGSSYYNDETEKQKGLAQARWMMGVLKNLLDKETL